MYSSKLNNIKIDVVIKYLDSESIISKEFPIKTKIFEIVNILFDENYLKFYDHDGLWKLNINTSFCSDYMVENYNRKYPDEKIALYLNDKMSEVTIYFQYYQHKIQRAKEIFLLFNGSKRWMYNDGIINYYESFNVPESLESEWLNNIVKY